MRETWNFWIIITTFNVADTFGKWLVGTKYLGKISDTASFILTYSRFICIAIALILRHQWGPEFLVGA